MIRWGPIVAPGSLVYDVFFFLQISTIGGWYTMWLPDDIVVLGVRVMGPWKSGYIVSRRDRKVLIVKFLGKIEI